MSLLVDFTNLLHRHGGRTDAPEVRAFIEGHRDDPAFLRRAKVMMLLFDLKDVCGRAPAGRIGGRGCGDWPACHIGVRLRG